ncbi:DEAD/DEAH box helicase family protein [Candidatus Pacearchaeota archaeon]|nr:DEAD/DEAH box helicase family protein [Candidatus Pacearchaeota archaeon]
MDKKQMSESDICMKYIDPAIEKAGWDIKKQVRREVSFTDGKILVYGKTVKRGKQKRADYILYYQNNLPLAIIEAKDNKHSINDGMQQAIEYGETLDIPFIFTSNGDGFTFRDEDRSEKEIGLNNFPSPSELWEKYKKVKSITKEEEEKMVTSHFYYDPIDDKIPRYYQRIAINRTVEAIAKGEKRNLLVMATGTGKTLTAFQIIHRLRSSWRPNGKKPRILYLADRNILIDQTRTNDFKPFSKVMTKVGKRKADKAYEVYMALYQGLTGNEDWKNIYKQFSEDFFDLIIVDECHRGSARADSAWREILTYFKSSTQIGMTATPKETKKVSNIDYFGEPVYTYSLKQGIEDGFLAPYRVLKVTMNIDDGYRPVKGKLDMKIHEPIPDGVYSTKDFDRNLVIDERTKEVAKKISDYLKNTDRFAKTIVFCVDIDHANRMRQALINENTDLVKENKKYIMKITGDDKEGKAQLDNFIDPSKRYPVIATTSKLMNTGVDAKTCKLIVLDSTIKSMTEFKQTIGRGTRIDEPNGKHYFTIMDFRKVTSLFADPDFDGDPVQSIIYTGGEVEEPEGENGETIEEGERVLVSPDISIRENSDNEVRKYHINNVDVKVINETVQYLDSSGKLITESLTNYTKKGIEKEYRSMEDFISKWNIVDQKRALIEELQQEGIIFEALKQEVGGQYDPFDLILHVAYGEKPISRKERAKKVKKDNYFDKYGTKAKKVIDALLDKYSDEGIENLEDARVLQVNPLVEFGRPLEIMKLFGGKVAYGKMIKELELRIYA